MEPYDEYEVVYDEDLNNDHAEDLVDELDIQSMIHNEELTKQLIEETARWRKEDGSFDPADTCGIDTSDLF